MRVELLQNRSRNHSSRHAKLSGNIPDDFPDLRTLDLYINPTSHDSDLTAPRPLASTGFYLPSSAGRTGSARHSSILVGKITRCPI
jgi:hypothetical protein